ncbi:Sua5/YciO/YrdC/YwlC family protein [Mycoplasmopsis glycophila]|uniref:L-threonylcarbamoyladenylate synthase n=1 Tax=Mycoplasmopsis glycophila TaxID=171285 RepID=A0A449AUS5_9BACT|nr:Sua5/YciO/YrdC/YwlC family protein [Mycoplasmopsis glycophila]VEU70245.1 Putative translation factor (SUA5) [Mycoplasmopsis glycophila]
MKYNFEEIIICTTDTVLGIGGPVKKETLDTIYFLKKRPHSKKIMILVGSIEQARSFKEWNLEADELAKKVWPGSNSIIVNDQGFRMPDQKLLIDYLLVNGPLYMTSCNLSGEKPLELEMAKKVFPNVSHFYNFGKMSNVPSKIYNLDTNEVIKRS